MNKRTERVELTSQPAISYMKTFNKQRHNLAVAKQTITPLLTVCGVLCAHGAFAMQTVNDSELRVQVGRTNYSTGSCGSLANAPYGTISSTDPLSTTCAPCKGPSCGTTGAGYQGDYYKDDTQKWTQCSGGVTVDPNNPKTPVATTALCKDNYNTHWDVSRHIYQLAGGGYSHCDARIERTPWSPYYIDYAPDCADRATAPSSWTGKGPQ